MRTPPPRHPPLGRALLKPHCNVTPAPHPVYSCCSIERIRWHMVRPKREEKQLSPLIGFAPEQWAHTHHKKGGTPIFPYRTSLIRACYSKGLLEAFFFFCNPGEKKRERVKKKMRHQLVLDFFLGLAESLGLNWLGSLSVTMHLAFRGLLMY